MPRLQSKLGDEYTMCKSLTLAALDKSSSVYHILYIYTYTHVCVRLLPGIQMFVLIYIAEGESIKKELLENKGNEKRTLM